jgi:hypothetical protein
LWRHAFIVGGRRQLLACTDSRDSICYAGWRACLPAVLLAGRCSVRRHDRHPILCCSTARSIGRELAVLPVSPNTLDANHRRLVCNAHSGSGTRGPVGNDPRRSVGGQGDRVLVVGAGAACYVGGHEGVVFLVVRRCNRASTKSHGRPLVLATLGHSNDPGRLWCSYTR